MCDKNIVMLGLDKERAVGWAWGGEARAQRI